MRRFVMAVVLLAIVVLPSGCGDGMVYSAQEYRNIRHRVHDTDRRQLVDDWHYLWLEERPSRMSVWAGE